MISTSSSFNYMLDKTATTPTRAFYIGSEDFSDRVMKWPTIEREVNNIKSVSVNLKMSNHDGYFNDLYRTLYRGYKKTCYLGMGYGSETIPLYFGEIYAIRYPKEGECELKLRDKFWGLNQAKVGDNTTVGSFGDQRPSELVWTLITSYGGFSSVASTSNPDISYSFFNSWSSVYSVTPVRVAARYTGSTVAEAVSEIIELCDAQMWLNNSNQLCFKALENDNSINSSMVKRVGNISPDIDAIKLTTRTKHSINYSTTSGFGGTVNYQVVANINSWGVHEKLWDSQKCWLTTSESAINLGGRYIFNHGEPIFTIKAEAGFRALRFLMSERTIITNSFYDISSSDIWRIIGAKYRMDDGITELIMEPSIKYSDAFYLDVHYLDGSEYLY